MFTLVLYEIGRHRPDRDIEQLFGEPTEEDPDTTWSGQLKGTPFSISRGGQISYDDRSLELSLETDQDYYLRIEPDNWLRRLIRFPLEYWRGAVRIQSGGPLSKFLIHTTWPEKAFKDLEAWNKTEKVRVLDEFHHVEIDPDGRVEARLYPGFPIDKKLKKLCDDLVGLFEEPTEC